MAITTMQWEGNPNVQEAGQIRPAYRAFLEQFREMPLPWKHSQGQTDKIAVIIDNRWDDPSLPLVIKNFRYFLGADWAFQHIIPDSPFGPKELNAMLLDPKFWEGFDQEHILIFQRDTICCQPLDPKYLEYDFIGAPCGFLGQDGRGGISLFDMNGGLSLRRRSALLKALDQYPVGLKELPEDVFFSRALRSLDARLNARLPDFETACRFSLESEPFYRGLPFGVHGTDKHYHSDELAQTIVDQIKVAVAA